MGRKGVRKGAKISKVSDSKSGEVVDVRLDKSDGTFFAALRGEMFEGRDLVEVQARIQKRMTESLDVTWVPYLFAGSKESYYRGDGDDAARLIVQRGWFAQTPSGHYLHAPWLHPDSLTVFDEDDDQEELAEQVKSGADSDQLRMARSHRWGQFNPTPESGFRYPEDPMPEARFNVVVRIGSTEGIFLPYEEELYVGLVAVRQAIGAVNQQLEQLLAHTVGHEWFRLFGKDPRDLIPGRDAIDRGEATVKTRNRPSGARR